MGARPAQTVHLAPHCAGNPIPTWRGAAWYGHATLQQGHFITSSVDHWLVQYNATPARVLVEDEANYENLLYSSMTASVPGWLARQSAWQSQVGGATGFTYGGQGIWWACYNRSYVNGNCGPNGQPGYYTWDQALGFAVGGFQLPAMAAFWRRLPWHTFAPDGSAVVWDDGGWDRRTQRPYQKADPRGDYVVAYLPQLRGDPHAGPAGPCRPAGRNGSTAAYGGLVVGLNAAGAHRAIWFNPRTAVYTAAGAVPAGTSWRVPVERPGPLAEAVLDWVLLIEPAAAAPPPGLAPPLPTAVGLAAPPSGTSWVTSVAAGGRVRTGPVENGCTFRCTEPMNVTHLCRLPPPGSRNVQRVQLLTPTGAVVAWAAVDALNPASVDRHGFVCAAVDPTAAGPATLVTGQSYVLAATTFGCDGWHDDEGTTVTVVGGDAAEVKSVYGAPPSLMPGGGGAGHTYGPLNFYFV